MFDPRKIFEIKGDADFTAAALELFRFQAGACAPYREYIDLLGIDPARVSSLEEIPFLPVEFFKSRNVISCDAPPQAVFTSSGTTGSVASSHPVVSLALYEESFVRCFESFYGPCAEMEIFALLPGYMERQGSSLIYMVDGLIKRARGGGFFLDNYDKMLSAMDAAAARGSKILLIGVSFALWELAETRTFSYPQLTVMETGGMKGRREEITRSELHAILCKSFGVRQIHSEYGMTELLSQAYSAGGGVFRCPAWMKVMIRDLHDPFEYLRPGQNGGINVVDLANVYSCSFIETQDMGAVCGDGSFTVAGRIDRSEMRGCNLMVAG